jgi:hypothetical protein
MESVLRAYYMCNHKIRKPVKRNYTFSSEFNSHLEKIHLIHASGNSALDSSIPVSRGTCFNEAKFVLLLALCDRRTNKKMNSEESEVQGNLLTLVPHLRIFLP